MKIKTDSWHYKYIAKRWDQKPKALCWYFWKLIISVFAGAILGIIATGVAIGALTILTYPIWQIWLWDSTVIPLSLIFWGVIGICSSCLYRQWLYETGQIKRKIREYKEPGIVAKYMSAKHRKVCPLLNYEDRRW